MNDVDKIDQAIAAAKARMGSGTKDEKLPGVKPRTRLTPEERKARDEAREASRLERQRARDEKKAERAKQKEHARGDRPAHMAKVMRAAEKLPDLVGSASEQFDTIVSTLGPDDMFALAEHLHHHVRFHRTEMALSVNLKPGDEVLVKSGNRRFIGMTGTVEKVQRIRCYVNVPGAKRPVYLFTSDVEVLRESQVVNTVPEDDDDVERESIVNECEADDGEETEVSIAV